MSSVILFGGSGFVGTHLSHMLGSMFEHVYIADIRAPRWHNDKTPPANPRAVHVVCDVRKPIDPTHFSTDISHIVNLAAVHTSPGHPAHEYFEANILGARHICELAEAVKCNRIVFTSSISVYGPGEDRKTESSTPMPAIPYGSSKIVAEYEHRQWLARGADRRLSILRPAVVFGPGEGGNFTRIANAMERGFFAYPGRTDTVKSCIYVKDLCAIIMQRMQQETGASVANCCYPEEVTIKRIVTAFKLALGYHCPEVVVPLPAVHAAAAMVRALPIPFFKRMGLVPERIVKLVKSTNVAPEALVAEGHVFGYTLEAALADWSADCGGKHLY